MLKKGLLSQIIMISKYQRVEEHKILIQRSCRIFYKMTRGSDSPALSSAPHMRLQIPSLYISLLFFPFIATDLF